MSLYECPRCGTEVVQAVVEYDYCDEETNLMVNDHILEWQCPNCDWTAANDPTINAPNCAQSSENWSHE